MLQAAPRVILSAAALLSLGQAQSVPLSQLSAMHGWSLEHYAVRANRTKKAMRTCVAACASARRPHETCLRALTHARHTYIAHPSRSPVRCHHQLHARLVR